MCDLSLRDISWVEDARDVVLTFLAPPNDMFGLSPEIDLAFLVGRTVVEVHADAYQVRIAFDEGLDIECECQVDGAVVSLDDVPERDVRGVTDGRWGSNVPFGDVR